MALIQPYGQLTVAKQNHTNFQCHSRSRTCCI